MARLLLWAMIVAIGGCEAFERRDDEYDRGASRRGRNDGFDLQRAPAASAKAATRFDAIGAQIASANKADLAVRPTFMCLGLSEPMIFHRNENEVIASEGLVNRCRTDDELAAVISHELAKISAERDKKELTRRRDTDLPPAPALPRDVIGSAGAPDLVREAEAAYYTKTASRNRNREDRRDAVDPKTLAKNFMDRAGFKPDHLERAADLIRTAEENGLDRDLLRR